MSVDSQSENFNFKIFFTMKFSIFFPEQIGMRDEKWNLTTFVIIVRKTLKLAYITCSEDVMPI